MDGLRKLTTEETAPVDPKVLAELRAQHISDAAIAARIGATSEHGSAGVSPVSSYPRLPSYEVGFFGAAFKESPSTEQMLLQSPSPPLRRYGRGESNTGALAELTIGPPAAGDCDDELSGDSSHGSLDTSFQGGGEDGGVGFESGFVDPRFYSSNSLHRDAHLRRRRHRPGSRAPLDDEEALPEASPLSRALMRTSSTFENLIASGVMSHSFEDIGYAGSAGREDPLPRSPSPGPVTPPHGSGYPNHAGARASPGTPGVMAPHAARPGTAGSSGGTPGQGLAKPPLHRSVSALRMSSGPTQIPGMGSPWAGSPPTTLGACSPQSFGVPPPPSVPSPGSASMVASLSDTHLRQAVEQVLDQSELGKMTLRKTIAAVAEDLGTTAIALRPRKVAIREFIADYLAAHGGD